MIEQIRNFALCLIKSITSLYLEPEQTTQSQRDALKKNITTRYKFPDFFYIMNLFLKGTLTSNLLYIIIMRPAKISLKNNGVK